jgi:hypothetical protein
MRTYLCLAFLAVATPARADSFVELAGGISIPLGDDDWTNLVETSPTLAVRAGSVPNNIGGFLSVNWMPANTDAQGWAGPLGSVDISAHRFRLIAGPMYRHQLSNTLAVTGRAGVGADIAHATVEGTIPIVGSFEESETDVGFALDFAGGIWFRVGNVEIGGEVAIPFGFHDDDNDANNPDFIYTSYDFEIFGAVRLMSH